MRPTKDPTHVATLAVGAVRRMPVPAACRRPTPVTGSGPEAVRATPICLEIATQLSLGALGRKDRRTVKVQRSEDAPRVPGSARVSLATRVSLLEIAYCRGR